jgi:LuxR family maltose regulon positive regulatory protein
LNLAYYFAKQELFRLEKEQLQFNLKEIQALLKEIYGLKVPDAELERIEKHSEGWITAIQLILQKISVAGEDKAKETLNGYIASGEEVFDYFAREIFETQPREIQEFLMRTSILGYMNPEVCNCLLNIKKSHNILSYLATEHIFTIRGKGDFKYHALFRDFLFNKLKATLKEKTFRLLCQKTGRCFSIVKDYTTAVDYYLLSEDFAEAAKCLERCCHLLSSSGKFDTFLTLLSRIPSTVLKEHPYLLLEKSRILSFLGKWEDALKELIITKKVFQRQRNKKGMAATLNQLGFTHLLLMRPRRALFFEKKAFKLTRNQKLKAQILSDTGKINRVLGKYKEAERYLKKALAISHKIDNTEVEMQILVGLAQVCSEKSDFNKAVELYSALLPKYGDKNRALSFVSVCANAASLYVELGNFNRAEELLTMAEELASTYNDWRTIVYASGIRGKLYLCQNNYGKAIEQYENTLELNKKLNERLVKIYARIDIAHAYLMMDDLIHARNEFKKIEALISSKIPPPILIDYLLIKGKLALLEKKSKKAENSLHRATEIAEKHQIFYQEMITLYHLSNFYLINGNEARMTCYLKRCLDIAKQNGYNFFLIRQGKIDLKILEYALAKKIETDYVLDILTEIESPEAEDLLEQKAERQIAYDLSVQLFGKLELKDKHNKVAEPVWRTRRMKSLFAYLIMNKGARVPADYLVEIFWSDRGRKDGMHSLHEHISYLRKVLGTILAAKTQSRSIIIYKDRSYFLNPEINLKVDVLRFEKLLAEAEKIKSTERAKCIQLYQKALDLFKGDFCPNIDDAWSDEKRMYYRSICGKITQEIGDYHYERKEFSNSLQYYSRALDFDPCDEKIHLTIMRLLSAAGDRTGVLKQYRRLEKVLSQELKTKPSPEAQRVYKEHLK